MGVRANERAQRSAREKWAVRSKQMSEYGGACKRASEEASKRASGPVLYASIPVVILKERRWAVPAIGPYLMSVFKIDALVCSLQLLHGEKKFFHHGYIMENILILNGF